MKCLDDNQVVLLLDGALAEGALAEVEAHLDECVACRRVVGAAAPRWAMAPTYTTRPLGLRARRSRGYYRPLRGAVAARRGWDGKAYRAYDPELDRAVALKLLRTPGKADGRAG